MQDYTAPYNKAIDENELDIDANWFPQNLVSLEIRRFWFRALRIRNALPTSLTRITMDCLKSNDVAIGEQGFIKLPSTLRTFESDLRPALDLDDRVDPSWMLPSGITRLRLDGWRCEWLHLVPDSVTDLDLYKLVRPTDASEFDCFQLLPAGLRAMSVNYEVMDDFEPSASSPLASARMFAKFTRLKTLYVFSRSFEPDLLQHLPRSLRDLAMSHLDLNNDHVVAFIPPTLSALNGKYGTDWSSRLLIAHWPLRASAYDSEDTDFRQQVAMRYPSIRAQMNE